MKNLTLENIARAVNGTYCGEDSLRSREVTGVFTDSRKVIPGSLFLPIVGARVDGHSFLPAVFEAGAACCLTEQEPPVGLGPCIRVKSTLQALKDLAEFYLAGLPVKVVGITGSVGKTSTKEMIASVLSTSFRTLKTQGNFNNEIGLPLTVFSLTGDEEVAVLEMGISDFGEMSRLTKIARPDVAVITNVGYCHLENLKDRDGVLRAKTEIFQGLKAGGTVCLNGDDDKLATVSAPEGASLTFFGTGDGNQVRATQIEGLGLRGTRCRIHTPKGEMSVTLSVPGVHMVSNALAAVAVGLAFGMSLEDVKRGIENLASVQGRLNLVETGSYVILDDCYNANPVSMKSSMDILRDARNLPGRRVCLLGDMFELGENARALHEEVGRYAAECGIDLLITVGELSRSMSAAAAERGVTTRHFEDRESAMGELGSLLREGDSILVKASHGMKFPELVEFLSKN